jgi:LPS sulfotransferase NodH
VWPPKSYLICSVPRSSDGLLAGLLGSTGVAGRPREYFWRNDEPVWRSRWRMKRPESGCVRRALAEGSTPDGVFGARIEVATRRQADSTKDDWIARYRSKTGA